MQALAYYLNTMSAIHIVPIHLTFRVEVEATWSRGFNAGGFSPHEEQREDRFTVSVTLAEHGTREECLQRAITLAERAVMEEITPDLAGKSDIVRRECESWTRTASAVKVDGVPFKAFKRPVHVSMGNSEECVIE